MIFKLLRPTPIAITTTVFVFMFVFTRYTVILNDKQSIREAFLKRGSAFSDREVIFLMKNYFNVKCKGKQ